MEHLSDIVKTMDEIWRISKSDALIKIKSPYFASHRAQTDPSHKRFFTAESFDYFDPATKLGRSWPLRSNGVFKVVKRGVLFGRPYNIFVNVFNRILLIL